MLIDAFYFVLQLAAFCHEFSKKKPKWHYTLEHITAWFATRLFKAKAWQLSTRKSKWMEMVVHHKCTLRDESAIHEGEMTINCYLSQHTLKSDMKIHMRTHQNSQSGEKPYKSNLCPNIFRYKSLLSGHKRMHIKMKPFKCQHCHLHF